MKAAGEQELVFEHGFIGNLSRSIWQSDAYRLIPALQQELAFPILTVGINGSGTSLHQHEGTWLMLMHGRKAWWIADGSVNAKSFGRRDPCQYLDTEMPDGFHFCVQKAGELVYAAQLWWEQLHDSFFIHFFSKYSHSSVEWTVSHRNCLEWFQRFIQVFSRWFAPCNLQFGALCMGPWVTKQQFPMAFLRLSVTKWTRC